MKEQNKMPGINDAATKEELKKMFDELMSQDSDMNRDDSNPDFKKVILSESVSA